MRGGALAAMRWRRHAPNRLRLRAAAVLVPCPATKIAAPPRPPRSCSAAECRRRCTPAPRRPPGARAAWGRPWRRPRRASSRRSTPTRGCPRCGGRSPRAPSCFPCPLLSAAAAAQAALGDHAAGAASVGRTGPPVVPLPARAGGAAGLRSRAGEGLPMGGPAAPSDPRKRRRDAGRRVATTCPAAGQAYPRLRRVCVLLDGRPPQPRSIAGPGVQGSAGQRTGRLESFDREARCGCNPHALVVSIWSMGEARWALGRVHKNGVAEHKQSRAAADGLQRPSSQRHTLVRLIVIPRRPTVLSSSCRHSRPHAAGAPRASRPSPRPLAGSARIDSTP